jgi:hypothetical protein
MLMQVQNIAGTAVTHYTYAGPEQGWIKDGAHGDWVSLPDG